MKIAICDDDALFCKSVIENLKEYCRQNVDGALIETSVFYEALPLIKSDENFDAVFLDIEMQKINGIDAANRLLEENPNIKIVFITGYDNLVFEALSVYPYAFIRKKEVATEVPKVLDKILNAKKTDKNIISLQTAEGSIKIDLNEILCFTSVGHSVFAITYEKLHINIKSTLKALENLFSPFGFVRCHTSYLVNLKYIYSVERDKVVLDNGEEVPLSRYRAENVKLKFIDSMRSL